jgi:hypothetical protein
MPTCGDPETLARQLPDSVGVAEISTNRAGRRSASATSYRPAHQYSLPLARLLLGAGADPNDEQALRNASCGYPHDDDAGLALLLEHGLGRRRGEPWRARLGRDRHGELLPTPAQLVQTELRYSAQWNLPNRVRLLLRRCAENDVDVNAATGVAGRDSASSP